MGTCLSLVDKSDEAINAFKKSIEINSESNQAFGGLAGELANKGLYQEAINNFDRLGNHSSSFFKKLS